MSSSRRRFLQTTLAPAVAGGLTQLIGSRLCRALESEAPRGRFRRCIVLWMEGGPSQLDTFDPKPGGPRKSVATPVAGIRLADSLPALAAQANDLCLLRSVGSGEGEHNRATEYLHTGFTPQPSFPRPAFGAMVSHHRPATGFPKYVTLGGAGFGPAFLGSDHGPFVVEDIDAVRGQLQRVADKRRAMKLLTQLNADYSRQAYSPASVQRSSHVDSVRQLLDTPFPRAFDLDSSPRDRERYGDHEFGRRVLAARRLSQLGVPFVEAQLSGWDTHVDNQRRTDTLCRQLEQPWLALMEDLKASGLWSETLVVWMGEFGRTPRLNGRAGRDHFPEATPVVLAGGDLGGRVIGETGADGSSRIGERHSVADLAATLLTLLGLDVDDAYTTDFGSPTTMTDEGTPIESLT